MKKHIVLICEGGQQFGIIVEEMSVHKAIKSMLVDLQKKEFICTLDYILEDKEDIVEMWVKSNIVNAIVVSDPPQRSNVQTPGKKILRPMIIGPGGRGGNA